MILTVTFGLSLLLGNLQLSGIPASILLGAQDSLSAQSTTGQKPPQSKDSPAQSESTDIPSHGPAAPAPVESSPALQQPAPPTQTNTKPGVSRKKRNARAKVTKPPRENQSTPENTSVVVVRNGGTSDTQGQIASKPTVEQAPQQREETDSLLRATTSNLEQISGKELDPNRQDMVKQIQNYMRQSKEAASAGDVQGANNLAFKAHLLSDELVKH